MNDPIEHESCDYHDHEWDHTPEEVASDLPPGHGSYNYTDEELDAIVEDYHYGPTMAEEGFVVPPRLPEDGDIDSLPRISVEEFDNLSRHPISSKEEFERLNAGPSGAGPTDCMNCGEEDGKTRLGGLHCHDCTEDLSCL